MDYLAIDTSSKQLLCMARHGDAFFIADDFPVPNASSAIVPTIDRVLQAVGMPLAQCPVVACVVGPGSFTGLRIGVSVANALGMAGPLLLGCNALDVLVHGAAGAVGAIPSRTGFAYTSVGELSIDEVAALPSVGVAGSGAAAILDRAAYVARLDAYILAHADLASHDWLQPLYLKKSQAERLRDQQ